MSQQKTLLKIAIYLPGQTLPEIRIRYGDFEDWFAAKLVAQHVTTVTYDVRRGEYADLDEIDALIVTGSAASVCTNPEDWVAPLLEHLRMVLNRNMPALGVCFGHQALAKAAGATVAPHPVRREIGTTQLQLTEMGKNHPLFHKISPEFIAQETHEDVVAKIPADNSIIALAGNAHNPYQALAYSSKVFSVQFHPEITGPIMQEYLKIYGEKLIQEGEMDPETLDTLIMNVTETDTGEILLHNFLNIVRQS